MADAAAIPQNAAEIAVANAINHINGRNRVVAGGVGAGGPQVRLDLQFHAIFFRVAATYAELVPRKVQLLIEYMVLLKALLFFFMLVYVHSSFIKNPCTCLQDITDWPRDGVIRVEIIPNLSKKRDIWLRLRNDQTLVQALKDTYYYSIGPQSHDNHRRLKRYEKILRRLGMPVRPNFAYGNETFYYYFDAIDILDGYDMPRDIPDLDGEEQYIVEYSLEYGHLRLSAATRQRLNIPVLTVQLDPDTNKCFGDATTRYLLKNALGYDDLLMASVRTIAEKEDNKGYLRNVITGEQYRFVSMWWAAWSSYPAAFCVMILFTFSVSMLLRYSHHQIFVFIVDLLQMMEYNIFTRFPIAPLLTVILALVGMEAIMSEFFNDTTTAFYIILIIWIADQFDAVCCHTSITKRHWLRFFFLYHFTFYAYHYRFSGQYRNLALFTSYLFIQHSMLYFFHRYELPAIMAQRHVFIIAGNAPNAADGAAQNAGAENNAGNGGVPAAGGQQASMQRARFIVTRILRQLAAQRQGEAAARPAANAAEPAGANAGPGDVGAAAVPGQAAQLAANNNGAAALAVGLGNLRRLPLVGQWLQQQQQFATERRVFLGRGHGHGQMMHVRLQRINMADVPGLRTHVAAQAAAAAATVAAEAAVTAAAEAAVAAAAAATSAAEAATVAAEAAIITINEATTTTATTTEDVESNQGLRPATATTRATVAAAIATENNINDAGATVATGETSEVKIIAEAAKDKRLDLEQAGVPKMLKNLNSVAADIINMPDTKAAAVTTTEAIKTTTTTTRPPAATTTITETMLMELPKQLANNLPAQRTQQTATTSSSGERIKESNSPSTWSDQQSTAAAAAATSAHLTSKQANVEPSPGPGPGPGPGPAASVAGSGAGPLTEALLSKMMDGRQTVDFIEGDSFTSTANYDANDGVGVDSNVNVASNHIKQQEQEKFELEQPQPKTELMKTSPHTSNQVTTAAEAATANN